MKKFKKRLIEVFAPFRFYKDKRYPNKGIPFVFYIHIYTYSVILFSQKKPIFDCAQAARARPFSAARERAERERKGGSHVSPL